MNEEKILEGCLKNNSLCQDELYSYFSPRMFGICYRYAKNRYDAEEILQEGFIKVFTQIKQFRNEGSLEGWIRKIIINTCINYIKRNKKYFNNSYLIDENSIVIPQEEIASMLESKQMIECIKLLPPGYRTVLNLYVIDGYSHKEISELLDITAGSSRSQFTRAKSLLSEILFKKKLISRPFLKRNQIDPLRA